MKIKLPFALALLLPLASFAQQAPFAAHLKSGSADQAPDEPNNKFSSLHTNSDAQIKLLNAQTKAIVDLNEKITKLEARIKVLEEKNGK